MPIYNYKKENDVQNDKCPQSTHLVIEHDTYGIYFVDASDNNKILKTTDDGVTVSTVIAVSTGTNIKSFVLDRTNGFLYYSYPAPAGDEYAYIDLSDDSNTIIRTIGANEPDISEILLFEGTHPYLIRMGRQSSLPNRRAWIAIVDHDNGTQHSLFMGASPERIFDKSLMILIGDEVWFLWQFSDENVEIWKHDWGDDTWTQMEDCGAGTMMPFMYQKALTYDGSDIISFVLGDGTQEVFTIVTTGVHGTLVNGEYMTFSAFNNFGKEINYYLWFDPNGDSSSDPAPAGMTGIQVDTSGNSDDQDLSDSITSALDGVGPNKWGVGNGVGTSETVTVTLCYAGAVTNAIDVDSSLAVTVTIPGVDSIYYYYTYALSTDTLTKGAEYNIALMVDHNTDTSNDAPFNLEKGFHTSSLFVYQISKNISPAQLYKIEDLTDLGINVGTIVAITDTYLFIKETDGNIELWKYQDNSSVYSDIFVKNQVYSHNMLPKLNSDFQINSDVVVEIYDSQTPPELLFRGKLNKQLDLDGSREYIGEGLEKSDLDDKFTGSYSTIDIGVIARAIYNDGAFTYADDTSCPALSITATLNFKEFEKDDALDVLRYLANGVWYVEPNGKGHIGIWNALVDSGIVSTQATGDLAPPPDVKRAWNPVNYIDIEGAYNPDTGQPFSSIAQDAPSILVNGKRTWDGRNSFPCCETQASLDQLSAAILAYKGVADNPTLSIFGLKEHNRIQAGQYMSLQFTPKTDLEVATDYPILKVLMDVKDNHAYPMLVGNDLKDVNL